MPTLDRFFYDYHNQNSFFIVNLNSKHQESAPPGQCNNHRQFFYKKFGRYHFFAAQILEEDCVLKIQVALPSSMRNWQESALKRNPNLTSNIKSRFIQMSGYIMYGFYITLEKRPSSLEIYRKIVLHIEFILIIQNRLNKRFSIIVFKIVL